ncbi:hypothetical protein EC912_103204 [Luteibacter rhizovicinus]|uniref:Uncharacterized protein n=1 Tax=Luteibacter rhizovicinus TaxID=242606 RepID=A0A4V2W475_9GAMM|nr:hypothetical protein [Luteibacter rhizovicinus]TCV94719.1 hypothetical protein EC912_103204 [Luteibacter rhizovicinus]
MWLRSTAALMTIAALTACNHPSPADQHNTPTPKANASDAVAATATPGPAWLQGEWKPYSNAFLGLHELTVTGKSLSWAGCHDVPFDIVDAGENQVTLRLPPASACKLNDIPPTRMDTIRLKLRKDTCDLDVSIFASPDAARRDEPSAAGLYGKPECPAAKT